jgi:hypothetical protein
MAICKIKLVLRLSITTLSIPTDTEHNDT